MRIKIKCFIFEYPKEGNKTIKFIIMETILKRNISAIAAKTQLFLEVKKERKNLTPDQAEQFFKLYNELTDLNKKTTLQWLEFKGNKKEAAKINKNTQNNKTTQKEALKIIEAALIELRDFLKLNFDLEYINPHSISFE